MNDGLFFTGKVMDDDGFAHDPELLTKFVAVMIGTRFDRNEIFDDTYGTPPSGPFSERASALLRDNWTNYRDGPTVPDSLYDGDYQYPESDQD